MATDLWSFCVQSHMSSTKIYCLRCETWNNQVEKASFIITKIIFSDVASSRRFKKTQGYLYTVLYPDFRRVFLNEGPKLFWSWNAAQWQIWYPFYICWCIWITDPLHKDTSCKRLYFACPVISCPAFSCSFDNIPIMPWRCLRC